MAVAPSIAMSARQKIPANIMLPPRELKHYRRWQQFYTTLSPSEQGYIPTAMEYEDFQRWLERRDSGYFSDIFEDIADHIKSIDIEPSTSGMIPPVTAFCGHPMHPVAAEQSRPRCPVCTIDIHLSYMKVLSQRLEAAGGRAPSCTLTASEHQDMVYSAWLRGKIGALHELSELESMAEKETQWSAAHPEIDLEDIRTAAKALELYWFETVGLQEIKHTAKKNNAVIFTEDTNFESGRPQAYYWKRSPRYEPGKYASIKQEAEEDGAISEDSEDYSQGVTGEPSREDPTTGAEEPLRTEDLVEDLNDSNEDTNWEDIDSDEDSSGLGDEESEGDYICFELEEETSYIVFDDDD
ncbi:Nn.00g059220.m01.CDS01 [Neocucurbitaria sp. VM-36]